MTKVLQVNEEDADQDRRRTGSNETAQHPTARAKRQATSGEQQAGQQFDAGVAPGDRSAAVAAAGAQGQKRQDRNQVQRPQAMLAPGAVGPGRCATLPPRGSRQITTFRNEPMARP